MRTFVFTSSIAIYGNVAAPHREDDVAKPVDPYGVAKLAVENDLRAATDLFGLRHVVLRPHNVYGERQNLSDLPSQCCGYLHKSVSRAAMHGLRRWLADSRLSPTSAMSHRW